MLAGLTAGRQSDEILVNLEFSTDRIIRIFTAIKQRYSVITVLPMHFSQFFQLKYVYCEACYQGA